MKGKKLYLSDKNKKIMGVCGGLGEYFDVDPTVIRLVFVITGLYIGFGLFVYLIMGLIIPTEPLN